MAIRSAYFFQELGYNYWFRLFVCFVSVCATGVSKLPKIIRSNKQINKVFIYWIERHAENLLYHDANVAKIDGWLAISNSVYYAPLLYMSSNKFRRLISFSWHRICQMKRKMRCIRCTAVNESSAGLRRLAGVLSRNCVVGHGRGMADRDSWHAPSPTY